MFGKLIEAGRSIINHSISREGIIVLTVVAVLIVTYRHVDFNLLPDNMDLIERRMIEGLYYLIIPSLVSIILLKRNPLAWGLVGADRKLIAFYIFIMAIVILPLVWLASGFSSFLNYYPQYKPALNNMRLLFTYEGVMFIYFFGWEYLFRGFMLFSLRERLGDRLAVLIQAIPFVILHIRKPEIESFASILAALILGVVALQTRSVLPGIIVHYLAAVGMDISVILRMTVLK